MRLVSRFLTFCLLLVMIILGFYNIFLYAFYGVDNFIHLAYFVFFVLMSYGVLHFTTIFDDDYDKDNLP